MKNATLQMKRVYVAGPYTHGDVAVNVRNALMAGSALLERGYYPYIPHLSHFMHIHEPQTYETWMELDMAWLRVCDVVVRLPGYSLGADREVVYAMENGIPVKAVEDL